MRWLLLGVVACSGSSPRTGGGAEAAAEEPPVALNAEPTVQYPPALYDQGVEGNVELRLFVDSTGRLVTESTRVAESSGNAVLDSAAARGIRRVQYAPARRHGLPVATSFLQTIEFRHPGTNGAAAPPPTRTDSTRPRRDSTRAVPRARPDSVPTPPPAPAPDSTQPKPDSSGAAS
jgi:TonB family protein